MLYWLTLDFFYPFLLYALISVFRLTDGTARVYTTIHLFFTSPMTSIHAGSHDNRRCERERACGGVLKRIGALKIFGCIWVQTPADWVAGECFIHCTMPLGQHCWNIITGGRN